MSLFQVSIRGETAATVEAVNWITALGLGLDRLGVGHPIDRLACEVLANGTVIARDARSGHAFLVQPVGANGAGRPNPEDEDTQVFVMEAEGDDPSEEVDLGVFMSGDEEDTELHSERVNVALVARVRSAPSTALAWQAALEAAQELVPSESGAALRVEPDGQLRFVGASGPHGKKVAAMAIPGGAGIAGFCVERAAALLVRNPYRDPRFFPEVDRATGYSTRAVLCVPVMGTNGVLGCLELLNPPEMQSFSRAHLATLESVAAALAARLEPAPTER